MIDSNMENNYARSNTTCMSDDVRELMTSLLRAKRNFKATGLSGSNNHQKYNYALLGDIYEAVEGALADENIIIVHYAHIFEGRDVLATRLIHVTTGQFIRDVRFMESEKPGNQAKGSANTYMKKYAVLSLCSISTEDDDGQEEEKYIEKKKSEPRISKDQVLLIQEQIRSHVAPKEVYNNILSFNRVSKIEDLPASVFNAVISYINKEWSKN